MSIFYKSQRIGKNGKTFTMYKVRTLREGCDKTNSFATMDQYTWCGQFLRKTKLDELPALYNVFKRDLNVFGYRPEEPRTFNLYPINIQEHLKKQRPGLVDLSSLHFFNEEFLLQLSHDPAKTYYEQILPQKLTLRFFYFENKCFLLNLAILWIALKKILKAFFKK